MKIKLFMLVLCHPCHHILSFIQFFINFFVVFNIYPSLPACGVVFVLKQCKFYSCCSFIWRCFGMLTQRRMSVGLFIYLLVFNLWWWNTLTYLLSYFAARFQAMTNIFGLWKQVPGFVICNHYMFKISMADPRAVVISPRNQCLLWTQIYESETEPNRGQYTLAHFDEEREALIKALQCMSPIFSKITHFSHTFCCSVLFRTGVLQIRHLQVALSHQFHLCMK